MLPLHAAEGLLRAYGVSVSAGRAVTSEDAAVAAADEELGYPVALKANGIVRRGRSERAGVALDLHDAAEVRRAWQGITEELGAAAMVEAVVQAMAPPGAELRVAVEPHPLLGPVVTFGLGGVLADAIDDRVPRLVPFGAGDAAAVIGASRAGRALDGDPRVTDAVIDLLERVGWLADDHPELDRLVINPALGSAEGAWVVDVTAHVATRSASHGSRAPRSSETSAACPARCRRRPSSSRPASSSSCVPSWPERARRSWPRRTVSPRERPTAARAAGSRRGTPGSPRRPGGWPARRCGRCGARTGPSWSRRARAPR